MKIEKCEICDYTHSTLECLSCEQRYKCHDYIVVAGGNCHVRDDYIVSRKTLTVDKSIIPILSGKAMKTSSFVIPSLIRYSNSVQRSKYLKKAGIRGYSNLNSDEKYIVLQYLCAFAPELIKKALLSDPYSTLVNADYIRSD